MKTIELVWEEIGSRDEPTIFEYDERAAVPGGWLYRTSFYRVDRENDTDEFLNANTVFVPKAVKND